MLLSMNASRRPANRVPLGALQVAGIANHQIEIAPLVAATGYPAAVGPHLRLRGGLPKQAANLIAVAGKQVYIS